MKKRYAHDESYFQSFVFEAKLAITGAITDSDGVLVRYYAVHGSY